MSSDTIASAVVDREASFTQFLYPFLFEEVNFDKLCAGADAAQWTVDQHQMEVWKSDRFGEEDLLPHVARYLNSRDGESPTARLWTINSGVFREVLGGRDAEKKIHTSAVDWFLVRGKKQKTRSIPFVLDGIKLSLFRAGVGFVAVCARPLSENIEDWLDFNYFFRFSDGQRSFVQVRAQRCDTEAPFFPVPAGGLHAHPTGEGVFDVILEALLRTARPEEEPWWHDVFVPGRMLPFATLYVDGVAEAEKPSLVYRVRKFFNSAQELYPPEESLRLIDNPLLHPYARGQWFTFSLDGGAFLALDAPPVAEQQFFRQTLPAHLRDQYFLLFLIALHQRFALMKLSGQVASEWLTTTGAKEKSRGVTDRREEVFRNIRDALLVFTARGYFTQVMQRENHHVVYRKWQQTFQVAELYQEVSDEVREMHNWLLMEKTEGIERAQAEQRAQWEAGAREESAREKAAEQRAQALQERISLLGVLIGMPALIIGFLGINIQGWTADEGLAGWVAMAIGFGGGLLGGWLVLTALKHRDK